MAVAFVANGQLHYLDPGEQRYRVGDWVLHPTSAGPEVCRVVWAPEEVDAEGFVGLPVCEGLASPEDVARDAENRRIRAEAEVVARALVLQHELPMKIVGVDYLDRGIEFDHLVVIYYTSPERVDFRALLGDLARSLRSRIDLRQVGARDATRISGGVGSCGRELCCSTFLTDFEPVSQRLARVQGLPTNPLQISGACGRLMCCLKYEAPMYTDFLQQAPAIGAEVTSPAGDGVVIGHSVPGNSVTVRTPDGEVVRCPLESVCSKSQGRKERSASLLKRREPAEGGVGETAKQTATSKTESTGRRLPLPSLPNIPGLPGRSPRTPTPSDVAAATRDPQQRVKKPRHKQNRSNNPTTEE